MKSVLIKDGEYLVYSLYSLFLMCGSGSVLGLQIRISKLLNTDPICSRIRLHNTGFVVKNRNLALA